MFHDQWILNIDAPDATFFACRVDERKHGLERISEEGLNAKPRTSSKLGAACYEQLLDERGMKSNTTMSALLLKEVEV